MAFGEWLRILQFRSVSLNKMLTYPLKWIAGVFQKENVVMYLTSPKVEKNDNLIKLAQRQNLFITLAIFSIHSPYGNVYSPRKQSRVLQTFCRLFPPP